MSLIPIFDLEMERGVLGGALLVGAPAIEGLTVDVGLRSEHFYWPQHAHIFAAMVSLFDQTAAIDVNTVVDRLRLAGKLDDVGGADNVDLLTACAPAAGDWHTYGECVVRDAHRRAKRTALNEALAAIEMGDEAAYAAAEARLIAADGRDTTTWDADATREHAYEWLTGTDDPGILTPFPILNRLTFGGLRRGDTTLVGGWTSHGKSTVVDGCLEHAAGLGHRCHLYINEMSLMSRGLRTLASMSGVPYSRLLQRELDSHDHTRVVRALDRGFPFSMTNVAGWRGPEICRHIIARRWDMAALDSINLVAHRGTEGMDELSSLVCGAAQRADSQLLVVVQLNRARADSGVLPLPVERDIRETAKLSYDAGLVLFVHRDQEEATAPHGHSTVMTGEVRRLNTGLIVVAKARNGELGKCPVTLDTRRMRYTPSDIEIPELAT